MKTFAELKKNLKKDFTGLKTVKLAILGDTATQFICQAIRGTGFNNGFDIQILEADFNQIERQILDNSSELYQYQPDVVLVFFSTHKLLAKYNKSKFKDYSSFAKNHLTIVEKLFEKLSSNLSTKVIYYNHPEINDGVYGNHANKIADSFLFQLRKLNFSLMEFAIVNSNFYIADMASLQNQIGKVNLFKPSIYINTEMVLSIDALPEVANITTSLIGALQGSFKKCLILDLDNTLWGGIIGDDGVEKIELGSLGIGKAFTEFQYWVKKLKERGIIIAICSKNTESIAKEPFEKHPEMILRLEDIAVFIANWQNKADNIRHIQSVLNIGFDSMVFIDDNPFERNLVKENIEGITVPDLPEDPAEYLEFLYPLHLFETVSFSTEDADRTKQYQLASERSSLQKSFTNEDDFLKSLQMVSVVEAFNKFNTPRVAQLTQRSNQFNLRTMRYTDADIEEISNNNKYYTFSFTLEDKFGKNGLIAVVILSAEDEKTLFIETWLMSCRVLKRGMELFTLNSIVEFAKENGFRYLKGEYIPTQKNELVKSHYKDLGFEQNGDFWLTEITCYEKKQCYINKK